GWVGCVGWGGGGERGKMWGRKVVTAFSGSRQQAGWRGLASGVSRAEGGGEAAVQVLRRRLVATEHDRVEQPGPDAGLGPPGHPEVFAVDDRLADPRRHVHGLRPFLIAQAWAEIGRVHDL